MKKGKKYHGMITAVFLLLYFVSMFFATYLVKEDYTKDYMAYLSELDYEIKECFMDENRIVFSDDTLQYKDRVGAYFKESIYLKNMGKDKYQMISMAIYDEKGNLLIHTGNMFGDMFHMYQFEDFFLRTRWKK